MAPLLLPLLSSLAKIYRDKQVTVTTEVADPTLFRGVEDDLLEVLGNLLDNAHKWCRHREHITAREDGRERILGVGDDGPGIDPEQAQRLLARGVRADECAPGHDIGLSVVREICQAYGGVIAIDRSPLGGILVRVSFKVSGSADRIGNAASRQHRHAGRRNAVRTPDPGSRGTSPIPAGAGMTRSA